MRIGRIVLVSLIASAVALAPGRAQAIFHLAVIDEVLASLDGDEDQQFVEIRMLAAVQNFVSNSVLATFDEDGDYIEDVLLVPANVENAGAGVRLAELLRLGPGVEVGVRAPNGVRGIEHVVLPLRPPEQMEGDEARQLVQVALAAVPDVLEVLRAVLQDLEPVHGDVHPVLLQ